MGVFTRLDASQLAAILDAWGLRDARGEGVPQGAVNTWYRVERAGVTRFLRLDERGDDDAVATELAILGALSDLPVPRLIPTRDGAAMTRFGRRPCLLFDALAGAPVVPAELTVGHLASLGAVTAALHRAPVPGGLARHRFHPRRVFEQLYLPVRERTCAEHPAAAAALDALFASGWEPFAFEHLPRAIVHGDLFFDNLHFVGERLTGLLDFEAAGEGPRLFDLAVAVHALCFEPAARAFARDRARWLIEGYRAHAALTPAEVSAWPTVLRYAASRFLVTRLRDFEYRPGARAAGTWKDHREYLHLLDALDGVAGLLEG